MYTRNLGNKHFLSQCRQSGQRLRLLGVRVGSLVKLDDSGVLEQSAPATPAPSVPQATDLTATSDQLF